MSSYSVWLKDGEENTRLFDVDINNGDTSTRNALMAYKRKWPRNYSFRCIICVCVQIRANIAYAIIGLLKRMRGYRLHKTP